MIKKSSFTYFFMIALFVVAQKQVVRAQRQPGWSEPYQLSSYLGTAGEGLTVSDPYGYVHAFWNESSLPTDSRAIIQYARFDGRTWSSPIDVYAAQSGGTVNALSPSIDQNGWLHLVWTTGSSGPVFYMNAPVHAALNAKQWSEPHLIEAPANRVQLQSDPSGNLHLLYAELYSQQPGIYYIRSTDRGRTWISPIRVDLPIGTNQGPNHLQLKIDDAGGLHAIWSNYDFEAATQVAVYYSHSYDDGDTWSDPFVIDEADESSGELRAATPGLVVSGQAVHVIWAGTEQVKREHRFSLDAGRTWGETYRIFDPLVGQALGDGLAVDGTGRIHYMGMLRFPQGLYHAVWERSQWSLPEITFLTRWTDKDEKGDRIEPHNVRLTVRNGNQLVVTFTDSPGSALGRLFAMHWTLDDVPPLEVLPTPTPTPTGSATLETMPMTVQGTATPVVATPTAGAPSGASTENRAIQVVGADIWLTIIPSLLFISGVIVLRLLHRRQTGL